MSAPLRQQALAAFWPVLAGRAEALDVLLRERASHVCVELERVSTLHFARFVLLPNADAASSARGGTSLLFATTFDGDLDPHLVELWAAVGPTLDKVFSHCEGWRSPGSHAELARFIRPSLTPASALFSALPGLTVAQIRADTELRAELLTVLDGGAPELRSLPALALVQHARLLLTRSGSLAAHGGAAPVLDAPSSATMSATLLRVLFHHGLSLASTWLRSLVLDVLDALGAAWQDTAAEAARLVGEGGKSVPQAALGRCVSHVSTVKTGRARRAALRLALRVVDELARAATERSGLASAESIHGARWLLLGDGRLVFLCDGDAGAPLLGSALVERARSAISMLWSQTERFPLTLGWRFGGARNEASFRRWAAEGALEAPLWYSAYPELGTREMRENSEISALLRREPNDASARRLLALVRD